MSGHKEVVVIDDSDSDVEEVVLDSDSDSDVVDIITEEGDVVFESHIVNKSIDKKLDSILEARKKVSSRRGHQIPGDNDLQIADNGHQSDVKAEKVSPYKNTSPAKTLAPVEAELVKNGSPFKGTTPPMVMTTATSTEASDTDVLTERTSAMELTSPPKTASVDSQTSAAETLTPTEVSQTTSETLTASQTSQSSVVSSQASQSSVVSNGVPVEESAPIDSSPPVETPMVSTATDTAATREERYVCSYEHCLQEFADAVAHYKHEKRHLIALRDNNEKPFPCTHRGCPFRASTHTELIYHNSEHLKVFMCRDPRCLFRAKAAIGLNNHMKKHRKGKTSRRVTSKEWFCDCGERSCDPAYHDFS